MFKKTNMKALAVLLIILMVVPLWGCGSKSGTAQTELDRIKKAGKIVVGTSADYPPYEFHAQINGKDEIVGFDIAIAKEIAKDLGVQLEIKDMDFKGLLAALQTGNVDFVIAGMNPTPDRAKQVDFSKIYYTAVQGVVVREDNIGLIKTINDLNGKKIGVQKGTVQEQIATEQLKGADIKALGKVPDLILELKNKNVDALIMEHPVAAAYVNKNKGLVISDVTFNTGEEGSAVAIGKNKTEVLDSINKTLDRLMADKSIEKFFADASELMDK
jgi:polar amino acid transport system substrate-binding protein